MTVPFSRRVHTTTGGSRRRLSANVEHHLRRLFLKAFKHIYRKNHFLLWNSNPIPNILSTETIALPYFSFISNLIYTRGCMDHADRLFGAQRLRTPCVSATATSLRRGAHLTQVGTLFSPLQHATCRKVLLLHTRTVLSAAPDAHKDKT